MEAGEINFVADFDAKQVVKELNRLRSQILKMENDLSVKNAQKSAIETQLENASVQAEETRARIEELKKVAATYNWDSNNSDEENQRIAALRSETMAKVDEETAKLKEQEAELAAIEKKHAKISESIEMETISLNTMKDAAGEITKSLIQFEEEVKEAAKGEKDVSDEIKKASENQEELNDSVEDGNEGIKDTGNLLDGVMTRIRGLAKRVFFFSLIAKAFRSLLKYINESLAVNKEYSKSIATMKASLMSMAYPILQFVTPAVIALTKALTLLFSVIGRVISFVMGKSYKATVDSAKALEKEKKALNGVGGAANKASKSLASFDEINQIGEDDSGGGGAGAGLEGFDGLAQMRYEVEELQEALGAALLALGVILLFTGHPVIGAALIAAGAIALVNNALNANGGELGEEIKAKLQTLMAIIGPFLFVIGLLLCLVGFFPVGIGLMLLGAAFVVSAVALDWNAMDEKTQETLTSLMEIISVCLLAIGVFLLITGVIPIGLALTVAGALLMYQAYKVNWEEMKGKTEKILGELLKIIGAAIAVIGVLMLFMGHPLIGLAMIIAGATIFAVGTQVPKWDEMNKETQKTITSLLKIVGGAIAILGVILLFCGLAPLGLGMIVAGVGIFGVGVVGANFGFMPDQIKAAWESIKAYYNQHIAKYLTFEYWKEKAKNLIEGFKAGISGIGSVFSGFGSAIIGGLSGLKASTPSLARSSVPALASGAVIPPNRKFLAMLGDQTSGTNVEAPLSTIEQAVENVMARTGGGGNQKVVLMVGEEEFGELTYRLGNQYANRVGVNIMEGPYELLRD